METNPPTASPVTAASAPGLFGTKIPSSVAFVVAVLLLLLPISEIKCGGKTLLNQTGIGFALGKDWKSTGGLGSDMMGDLTSKTSNIKKGNTQAFAGASLALGVIGILLTLLFTSKGASSGGVISGVLAAGSLIALMFEVKKGYNEWLTKQASDKASKGAESLGLGNNSDSIGTTLAFTPWFYIAVIAFLAAAFFCYKRMSANKG